MSAFSFQPRTTAGGSGVASGVAPTPPSDVIPIYAESTTPTNGVTTLFAFTRPIARLIMAIGDGSAIDPASTAVASGELDLSALATPLGDPANVGLVKVGALYLPTA